LANVSNFTPAQRSAMWERDDLGIIIYAPRTRTRWGLFGEIFSVLKGQIQSKAIALLVPTRLVVLGQSKDLKCIARVGVMIDGVLTPQTLPLGSGGSDGSGINAGPEDASRKRC